MLLCLHFLLFSPKIFTGRYQGHSDLGSVEYGHHSPHSVHYEQSFQTVPSSVPPTPSPDQWSSELSPHSNNSNSGPSSVPPPAHHHTGLTHSPHHHHHHHHTNNVNNNNNNNHLHHPLSIHPSYQGIQSTNGRDNGHNPLSGLSPVATGIPILTGHHHNLLSHGEGRPIVQAAVLAGK